MILHLANLFGNAAPPYRKMTTFWIPMGAHSPPTRTLALLEFFLYPLKTARNLKNANFID